MYVFYASVNIISIVFNIPRMCSQHRQHHQQLGFPHLMVKVRIQLKAQGGWGERQSPLKGGGSPPMMIEKLGAKNLRSNGRMMIEKVMIQLGAKSPKIAGGLGGGASPPHDD